MGVTGTVYLSLVLPVFRSTPLPHFCPSLRQPGRAELRRHRRATWTLRSPSPTVLPLSVAQQVRPSRELQRRASLFRIGFGLFNLR
ncbi:unnamed protein product [Cuscuta campestris]|uniref:Uncharacterized protein n=1 Tax=Cuscuta campestris TaxID=132261 RepID=A0A484MMV0_9ASTE|nr:unnamed protein product [Cuscuta campestris]